MQSDATADWAAEDETVAMVMDELGLEEAERAAAERAVFAQQLHSIHETLAEMIKKLAAEAADSRLKGLTDEAERGAREHVTDHIHIRSFFNAAQTMLQQARTLAVEQI